MSTIVSHQRVHHYAEGEHQAAREGFSDGNMDIMKVVFYQPAGSHDAPLLDEVFGCFMDTNLHQRSHYTFHMLLQITEKRFFTFRHSSVTYLATVYRYHGADRDTVTLKLPNDGFSYLEKIAGRQLFRHKQPGWVLLPGPEAVGHFPQLQRIARQRYSEIAVFYSLDAKSIDMKFKPKDAGEPILMVTYEPGSPYIDEEDMWRPF